MKIRVNPHTVEIVKEQTEPINEREIKVSKCEFEFDEVITNDFVKEAYFTLNGNTYKMIVENNECDYPSEVLAEKGTLEIGVVAFKVENGEEIVRYNPSPDYFESWVGSLKDAENSEPITPSDKEQIEQMLANINIDAEKVGRITTITYVNKDGIEHQIALEDGKSIEYDWQGTSLGIRQEGQSQYQYVDLQGPVGPAGAIKLLIVQELPETGEIGTLYFVPKESSKTKDVYDEYMWINNDWERVGEKQIVIDLSNYVQFNDYATSSKGGVLKVSTDYGVGVMNGTLAGVGKTYQEYTSGNTGIIISKGTLENVFTGKGFITNQVSDLANYYNKTYIDALVGDINTALDTINGEVI